MKRYTRKVIGGEYEGSLYNFQKIVNKLGEYEDAEEQGLFVKLPCKVGDVVYRLEDVRKGRKLADKTVVRLIVDHFEIGGSGVLQIVLCDNQKKYI